MSLVPEDHDQQTTIDSETYYHVRVFSATASGRQQETDLTTLLTNTPAYENPLEHRPSHVLCVCLRDRALQGII